MHVLQNHVFHDPSLFSAARKTVVLVDKGTLPGTLKASLITDCYYQNETQVNKVSGTR